MSRPSHRYSTQYKLENKDAWQIPMANFIIKMCTPLIPPQEAQLLYKAATGEIEETDYLHILPVFGDNKERFKSYPSKIRNYPIIPRAVLALLAEKATRPIIAIVSALNSNYLNKQAKFEFTETLKSVQQKYLIELQQMGIPVEPATDEQGNPIPPKSPEQIEIEKRSLPDNMSKAGQDAIDYFNYANELPAQFRDGFFHWIVTGKVTTYKDVRNDELEYSVFPPSQLSVIMSKNVKYIEDAEGCYRTFSMPLSELDDLFYENEEYNEIRDDIEKLLNRGNDTFSYSPNQAGFWFNDLSRQNLNRTTLNNELILKHVVFSSETKIGKLITPLGEEIEVDDTYEPTEFDDITWTWVKQLWEGYIIADRFYIGFQPIPLQRLKTDNPNAAKSPYNGRIYGSQYAPFQSIVKTLFPYQVLRNIIKFHIEKLINKNKDKIILTPYGLLPNDKEKGLDPLTALYYSDSTGVLFVDETEPNAINSMQHVRVLDASLNDIIIRLHEYDRALVAEADELIGLTPQRMGQNITPSSGLGTTQEAIYRGSLLTEELFREFDEFQAKEYTGFLDLSPFVFARNHNRTYLTSDFQSVYREFYGEDLQQITFGVAVKYSTEELKKLETFRQWGFNFTQNGMKASVAGKLLDSTNFVKMLDAIEEAENIQEQAQNAQAEAERSVKAEELNIEANKHLDDLAFNYYKVNKETLTSRLNKAAELEYAASINDGNLNGKPDSNLNTELSRIELERQKIELELLKLEKDTQEKNKDRALDYQKHTEKLANDLKKAQISKRNKPTSKK